MLKEDKVKKAIDNIVKNRGNVSKSMREAGYSAAYSSNPDQFTATKKFQALAEQYLPDDFLLKALEDDIRAKPENRTAELQLAFKVKGRMIDRKDVSVTVDVDPETRTLSDSVLEVYLSEDVEEE